MEIISLNSRHAEMHQQGLTQGFLLILTRVVQNDKVAMFTLLYRQNLMRVLHICIDMQQSYWDVYKPRAAHSIKKWVYMIDGA